MATAAVIDFGSISSPSGTEQVLSGLGSRIVLREFVVGGCDLCETEFDGIVQISDRCAHQSVSRGEHYSLKYSPVVVVDTDHLAL